MASFLKRENRSASLENHFSGINISLEEEMIMTKDADNEVDSAEAEVAQIEAAENVVAAADQTADMIEENNGELDQNGVVAVDNLMTAAQNIAQDDGVNNPGDPLNEADTEKLIPVTESSGKFYVSIETFKETFSKIKKKILEICNSIWARIKAAYRNYFGAYSSISKRAADIVTRTENMAGKTIPTENKTFDITSGAQYLCLGDTQPTTNATGINSVLAVVEKVANKKMLTAMKELGKSLNESVKKADFSNDTEKEAGLTAVLESVKKYTSNVKASTFPEAFLAHTKFTCELPSTTANSTNTEQVNIAFQFRATISEGETKLKDSYKFTTMTVTDAKGIASKIGDIVKNLKAFETGMDDLEKHQKDLASASNALETKANKAEADNDKEDTSSDTVTGIVSAYNALVRSNTYFANNVTTLAKALKLSTATLQNALYWCNKSLDLHKS